MKNKIVTAAFALVLILVIFIVALFYNRIDNTIKQNTTSMPNLQKQDAAFTSKNCSIENKRDSKENENDYRVLNGLKDNLKTLEDTLKYAVGEEREKIINHIKLTEKLIKQEEENIRNGEPAYSCDGGDIGIGDKVEIADPTTAIKVTFISSSGANLTKEELKKININVFNTDGYMEGANISTVANFDKLPPEVFDIISLDTVESLTPGKKIVTFSAKKDSIYAPTYINTEVFKNKISEVTVKLDYGKELSGLVVDGLENPVPNADIRIMDRIYPNIKPIGTYDERHEDSKYFSEANGNMTESGNILYTLKTDNEGKFRIKCLIGNPVKVAVFCNSKSKPEVSGLLAVPGGELVRITINSQK